MSRYLHLAIIAGLAFFLSALTVPMCFLAAAMEARAEHGSTGSTLIRFVWSWGVDLTNGANLPEPLAELLMYAINFLLYCVVLCLAYRVYLLVRQ